MRVLAGLVLIALAGCSTPSDVVKTGADSYRVRPPAADAPRSDEEIRAYGIKRAYEYCDAQGQRAVITIGQTSSWFVFGLQTVEVQFFCDDRPAAGAPAKTS
jgi:hypothetical protein